MTRLALPLCALVALYLAPRAAEAEESETSITVERVTKDSWSSYAGVLVSINNNRKTLVIDTAFFSCTVFDRTGASIAESSDNIFDIKPESKDYKKYLIDVGKEVLGPLRAECRVTNVSWKF